MASNLEKSPPPTPSFLLTYPAPFILLVTINRASAMNSVPTTAHWEADALFQWFDIEPSLRVAIITGAGTKAFSAGQDLIEQAGFKNSPPPTAAELAKRRHPPSGFLGLSKRMGKKPVIAAVNGFALGGGFETCLNCDMVISSPKATFGLPEAGVGLYAAAGGLPRIVRTCGLQIASEVALAGRKLSASEALSFHLINKISASPSTLIEESVELAKAVTAMSPDAIIVTRDGLRQAWDTGVEEAAKRTSESFDEKLFTGKNVKIGLEAFAGRKKPQWEPSKL